MDVDIQQVLKGFGLSAESVERVRLSRGVVGRTTYAIIALFTVLAVVASRVNADLLLWVGGLAVLTFVIYFIGVLRFADRNPSVAMLEGAELLHWHQAELAAKGTGPMPASTALPPAPIDHALSTSPLDKSD